MSKMNDMAMTIEELRNTATAISNAADWLAKQFRGDADEQPAKKTAPKPEPQLTLEQVRAVLAKKSRSGHTATVRELLLKYGASKLSQIDPANYEALLRKRRCLMMPPNGHAISQLSLPTAGSTVRLLQGLVKAMRIKETTTQQKAPMHMVFASKSSARH